VRLLLTKSYRKKLGQHDALLVAPIIWLGKKLLPCRFDPGFRAYAKPARTPAAASRRVSSPKYVKIRFRRGTCCVTSQVHNAHSRSVVSIPILAYYQDSLYPLRPHSPTSSMTRFRRSFSGYDAEHDTGIYCIYRRTREWGLPGWSLPESGKAIFRTLANFFVLQPVTKMKNK